MISENRDPHFWHRIASHPQVCELLGTFSLEQVAAVLARPTLLPLASENGGFWFATADSLGRVHELHTLFTPEGWGREVHAAAKEAFHRMFAGSCDLIVTSQMRDNPRSQPPRSFGFRPAGDFAHTHLGDARTWVLTRDAWIASPARRTSCRSLH